MTSIHNIDGKVDHELAISNRIVTDYIAHATSIVSFLLGESDMSHPETISAIEFYSSPYTSFLNISSAIREKLQSDPRIYETVQDQANKLKDGLKNRILAVIANNVESIEMHHGNLN